MTTRLSPDIKELINYTGSMKIPRYTIDKLHEQFPNDDVSGCEARAIRASVSSLA